MFFRIGIFGWWMPENVDHHSWLLWLVILVDSVFGTFLRSILGEGVSGQRIIGLRQRRQKMMLCCWMQSLHAQGLLSLMACGPTFKWLCRLHLLGRLVKGNKKPRLRRGFRREPSSSLGVWQPAVGQLRLLGCIKTGTLKLHVLFAAIGQGHLRFLRNPGPRSVAWRVCASQMWGERCVAITTSLS